VLVIEVRGLSKRYGAALAVDELSFDVRPGHVTGFLGPNGAGKSTTMRLILGLDRPTIGSALVNGKPYAQHHNPTREIGALLEAKSVHQGRSAFNHLWCLAQAAGIGKHRVGEVLELVGLSGVAKKRTGTFSLGMAQRLGLAQALLGDPPILMLDEPVNGLDPEGIRWVREFLKHLAGEGRAVFVSSHLMSEMALMAEHLIIVGRGRLVADTSISEFVQGTGGHVRVRSPQPTELADELTRRGGDVGPGEDGYLEVTGLECDAVGDIAAERGLTIHELFGHTVSLEDAFMALTTDSVDYHAHTPAVATRTQEPTR
jgi:ABC-2 type transport system ATP-binding protein